MATAAAAIVIAAAYGALWWGVAEGFRDSVDVWVAARRADGLSVDYAALEIGGFPSRIEATIAAPSAAPSAATSGDEPAWTWRGSGAVVRFAPWRPETVHVDLAGDHVLTWMRAGRARTYEGTADHLVANLQFAGGKLRDIQMVGGDIRMDGDAGAFSLAMLKVLLVWPEPAPAETPPPSVRLQVAANGLRVPESAGLPLGDHIARLALDLDLFAVPRGASFHAAAIAWRDAGGTIEVRRLETEYGPLGVAAEGTLALDGALQPIGAFTARIVGFFETVDALRDRGLVRPGASALAKLVLRILAKPPADGGPNALEIPVTIQDRTLSMGPVRLVKLPVLVWPGATEE